MTIGWYSDHAFFIKDNKKITNIYACAYCNQLFTQAWNLQRHADRCTSGKTKVVCPGTVVKRSQSAYEKAFFPKTNASTGSVDWLEFEAEKWNLDIHRLHWWRVAERITLRLAVLTYLCIHGSAPEYLTSLLQCVSGIHTSQRLRSASSSDLMVPRTIRSTIGERSFQSAAASTWNALSHSVRSSTSVLQFRSRLKTELFARSYQQSYCICVCVCDSTFLVRDLEVFGFTSR